MAMWARLPGTRSEERRSFNLGVVACETLNVRAISDCAARRGGGGGEWSGAVRIPYNPGENQQCRVDPARGEGRRCGRRGRELGRMSPALTRRQLRKAKPMVRRIRAAIITIILSSFGMLPLNANVLAAPTKRLLKPHEPRVTDQRRETKPVTASPLSSPTNGASGSPACIPAVLC
jgi:hypothetical protein